MTAEAEGDRLARRNALILAGASALAGANAAVVFATGAIVGSMLAPSPSLATVPVSCFVVGMAAGTLPGGMITRRYGRRVTFWIGTGCGAVMGLLACVAVLKGLFWLFCCATFFGGLYASVAQSYRFAAADTASPAFRPRAISWVMAGGIFAGVLGPQLVNVTMGIWPPYLFAASYLAQAVVAIVAMGLLSFVRIPLPPPPVEGAPAGRSLAQIMREPRFIAALICGVVSYALMNLVMTSAPLAMQMCGLSVSDSNTAIQWHVVAMYAPSFITGSLVTRFGSPRVIIAGLALIAAAAGVHLAGITVWHFWIGMVLLGIGWNFGFVGATAMVAEICAPPERTKVQSFNDFLIFGTMAVGSFSSGHLLASYGWSLVNDVVFPPVVIALLVLGWLRFSRHGRQVPAV